VKPAAVYNPTSPSAVARKLLTDTHHGHAWLGALVGLVLLGVAWRRRASEAHWSTISGWCAAVVFVRARAFASYAAQQEEGATVQVAAQTLHVVAVSVWVGAVAAASRVRLPAIADPAADRTDAAARVLRLSTAATVALAILVLCALLTATLLATGEPQRKADVHCRLSSML